MGIGVGVFLLAVGLIMALAAPNRAGGFDLELIGWILAGAGVLSIVVGLFAMAMSRRTRTEIQADSTVTTAAPVQPDFLHHRDGRRYGNGGPQWTCLDNRIFRRVPT